IRDFHVTGVQTCALPIFLDPSERFLLIANFASGSTCVLPVLPDGSLGDEADWVQHEGSSVHPVRQKGPHAHAVEFSADGRFAYRSEERRVGKECRTGG